jgi:acetyl esterase/lipase
VDWRSRRKINMVSWRGPIGVWLPVGRDLHFDAGLATDRLAMLRRIVRFGPADPLNFLARLGRYQSQSDIAYGPDGGRMLDLYRPFGASRLPVIVFFHGGSWQSGDKKTYLFVAAALAVRGYVVIVPDYRVFPQGRFPDFLEDGASAVQWARRHAADHNGDADRLFLMGHSAGAHIAAMLSLDRQWLDRVGLDPGRDIAGLIGVSGPYDFLPLRDPILKTIFGGDRPETQPISFAQGPRPPSLLLTGQSDQTVDPGNTARLAAKLRQHGNEATDIVYRWLGHLSILSAFAAPVRFMTPLMRDLDEFVARTGLARRRRQGPDQATVS